MKMKKLFVLGVFIFMGVFTEVDAANNFVISAPSSVNVNANFSVSVKHSGETIGSLQMQIGIINAECSVQSTCSGGVANCNGGSCLTSFNLANGLKAGNNIITLSCHSTGGVAKFTASVANRDAWDVEGMKQLAISSASKSVTINGTTATTKKPTTTTTISKRPTTGRTTTTRNTTTSKTTSKNISNTTKKTTSIQTTQKTTLISTTRDIVPSTSSITSEFITSESTTTEEVTTTVYVPDDLKLKELKIVGYNINFKPNLSSYTIEVAENVDELYIIATPADEQTEIETIGLVDITGKDYIQIRVFNENAHHEINYKINIRRNKKNAEVGQISNIFSDSFKLIVFSMLAVIFFLILYFTVKGFMSKNKHFSNGVKEEYVKEATEELIPKSEEELKRLFDELDREQQK